eukprot:10533121-Lingulodinium_polyedra.AAC.1
MPPLASGAGRAKVRRAPWRARGLQHGRERHLARHRDLGLGERRSVPDALAQPRHQLGAP